MASKNTEESSTMSIIKEAVSKLLLLWSKDSELLKSVIVKSKNKIDLDATLDKIKNEIKNLL